MKNFTYTEKFYEHEIAAVDLSKIYFLKNANKTCKPNNRDLNRDWKIITHQALAWCTGNTHVHAITHTNQERGGMGGWWKACPKVKLHGLISVRSKFLLTHPELTLTDLTELIVNWLFQPYFSSLYFLRQIWTAATFCYFIYFQSLCSVASANMFYQKR